MFRAFILLLNLLVYSICVSAIPVKGVVLDERGRGLPGIDVSIDGLLMTPKTTDGTGEFEIVIKDPLYTPGAPITFQLGSKIYEPESPNLLSQFVPNPNIPNNIIKLIMRRIETSTTIKINGFVEAESSHPLDSVTITIYETGQTIKSDNNGMFTLFLSKKLLNTDITFRTVKNGYSSDPRPFSVTLISKPIILKMKSEKTEEIFPSILSIKSEKTEEIIPSTKSPFMIPKFTSGGKNSYLNFFINEGDPTQWVARARLFKLVSSDTKKISETKTNSFQMERHYSSGENNILGIFGFGWHHSYESRILLDKSTLASIVFMNFDGTRLYFMPTLEVETILKSIKILMPKVNEETTLETIVQYEIDNGANILGTLNNILYIGNDLSVRQLKILPRGFQLKKDNDSYFIFDKEGRLESLEQKGEKPLRIVYNIDGKIEGVTNRITTTKFNYNTTGLISSISYNDTLKTDFAYDSKKRLIQVVKKNRLIESFKYDSVNRMIYFYDMQKKDSTIIDYDKYGNKTLIENTVRKVNWAYKDDKDTLGVTQNITYYTFENGVKIEEDYGRRTIQYNFVKKSKELYMNDHDKGLKVYKIAACGCKTLEVRKLLDTIKYQYNYLGNVTKVIKDKTITTLSYDSEIQKIDTISLFDVGSNKIISQNIFMYDIYGNLIKASNNEGIIIRLKYNEKDQIEEMIENNSSRKDSVTTLQFIYNEKGKPIEIRAKGLGKITVTYNDDGEIDKVKSDEGSKMALMVTSSFQNLLEIVKPASIIIDTDFKEIDL